MMSRIGSEWLAGYRVIGFTGLTKVNPHTRTHAHTLTKKSFTLVEIMITTAILGLGIVMIYRAFFTAMDAFNYCSGYLMAQPWMDEKIWQAQDDLSKYGRLVNNQAEGAFLNKNKNFSWSLGAAVEDQAPGFDLYKVNLSVSWREGAKKSVILRQAYALYAKKE